MRSSSIVLWYFAISWANRAVRLVWAVMCVFVSFNGFVLKGECHCVLATKGHSVIEEKGEGFENGKSFYGFFGAPSTSSHPPDSISRLNISAYKSVMHRG